MGASLIIIFLYGDDALGANLPQVGRLGKLWLIAGTRVAAAIHVRTWPVSELVTRLIEVRSLAHGGLVLLTLSSSHFDPNPKSRV
jgi:hypothetical protein